MAAYVASARIDRVRPQLTGMGTGAHRFFAAAADPTSAAASVHDTSPPGSRDLELRWEAFRDRVAQLTFFLLDPESWR